jgi:2-hydroxy-6-oxonona-2,4-dienedioate hydrolase
MRRTGHCLLAALLAATGVMVLVFWRYRGELHGARRATTRGALIAATAAGRIEYAKQGVGIPLLSIHGAGGGYDQGLALATDLVGEGFQVIAPSRFGYLGTPVPPDTSPAAQADAHAALLSELNISRVVVLGVSAGARSAVELALRHPERVLALILIVPGTYTPSNPVSVEASRGSRLVFRLVNTGADFVWWTLEKVAPSVLVRFVGVRPDLLAASPKVDQDRVMRVVKSIEPLSLRVSGINIDSSPDLCGLPLEKIITPTLIVSARDDLFNTLPAAEFAASKIPGAKLVVHDTGGHLLVGHEDEVRGAVRTFLASSVISSDDAGRIAKASSSSEASAITAPT